MIKITSKKRYNQLIETEKNYEAFVKMPTAYEGLLRRKNLLMMFIKDVTKRLKMIEGTHTNLTKVNGRTLIQHKKNAKRK